MARSVRSANRPSQHPRTVCRSCPVSVTARPTRAGRGGSHRRPTGHPRKRCGRWPCSSDSGCFTFSRILTSSERLRRDLPQRGRRPAKVALNGKAQRSLRCLGFREPEVSESLLEPRNDEVTCLDLMAIKELRVQNHSRASLLRIVGATGQSPLHDIPAARPPPCAVKLLSS